MSNIMNLKDLKNNPHRSGFDLSFRNCFTAKVGEILPVLCDEVLPGDKINISLRQFMRTAPIQTASFGRFRQYYDFYFVPYRLLWDKFPSWVVQTQNAYHSSSLTQPAVLSTQHPYFTNNTVAQFAASILTDKSFMDNGNDRAYGMNKLMNMLGYGFTSSFYTGDEEVALNPFPLLAYQKIYQDYFRFAQWELASPWTYNLDFILQPSQLELTLDNIAPPGGSYKTTLFDLHSCNFDKDYFTGVLPSSQFGSTAIAAPIQGNLSGQILLSALKGDSSDNHYLVESTDSPNRLAIVSNSDTPFVYTDGHITLDNSVTAGLSVLAIRYAQCAQKWAEITQSGSPDYRDQIRKHWGLDVGNDLSYMCEYLGGISSDIDIQAIDNTNLTDSDALIKGKGLSANNGRIDYNSKDYGILMCVYHTKPLHEYYADNIMNKLCLKTQATDYAIPEFDSIGMQAVLSGETNSVQSTNDIALGYVPRYAEYKTKYDVVNGAFQTTLKPWTLPFNFATQKNKPLSYLQFKVPFDFCDNIFGVQANDSVDTDQLYCTAYFDEKYVRNLSRDGLPY